MILFVEDHAESPKTFAQLLDLVLQPLPSEQMEAHEVSTLVNLPENDCGFLSRIPKLRKVLFTAEGDRD